MRHNALVSDARHERQEDQMNEALQVIYRYSLVSDASYERAGLFNSQLEHKEVISRTKIDHLRLVAVAARHCNIHVKLLLSFSQSPCTFLDTSSKPHSVVVDSSANFDTLVQ